MAGLRTEKMITVKISHQDYKYQATPEEQKMIDEIVNDRLESMLLEITAFRAGVNAILTPMGNFKIEAVCDDYLIQERMEDLLPKVVPNLT